MISLELHTMVLQYRPTELSLFYVPVSLIKTDENYVHCLVEFTCIFFSSFE